MADEKWYAGIDESLHSSIESFEDVGALAKSYAETKKMVGDSIRVPGEDAGEEAIKAFNQKIMDKAPGLMLKPNLTEDGDNSEYYKMLGRPDDQKDYAAEAPDGTKMSDESLTAIKEASHKAGLSSAQYKQIVEALYADEAKGAETKQTSLDNSIDDLKKEWGNAYDDKLTKAVSLSKKFFGDVFDAETIPPEFAKGMDKLLSQMGKEAVNQDDDIKDGVMTPTDAKAKIAEIYANPKHPFLVQNDPQHQDALQQMLRLQRLADPE